MSDSDESAMAASDGTVELGGKKYTIVTVDFETFYDSEFTLQKKLSTSEYVRDERFKTHGVGIKVGEGNTLWYTGKDIQRALKKIRWKESALLAHNTAFDGFILTQRYGCTPALYLDTLSMARAAHGPHVRHDLDTLAKMHGLAGKVKKAALVNTKGKRELTNDELCALGAYCIDDVDDTYRLFHALYNHIPDPELQLIHMTIRMFCEPVLRIDVPRVQAELEREVQEKSALLKSCGVPASDLMSNPKFAECLRKLGVEPPMKISPTTGKETFAFAKADLEFQALGEHRNAKVRNLYKARIAAKSTIGETRAQRFLNAAPLLPVMLNYSGAHTHRWSGGNKMNLQNLKRGGELRRSILAPEGYSVVVSDSAQIEARMLAWLAGQDNVVEAFATGKDNYKIMASYIYNIPVEEVTKDQRFIGKVCTLGLGYGMGASKLCNTLAVGAMGPAVDLPLEECQRIVNIYRTRNAAIKRLWAKMENILVAMYVGREGTFGPISYGKGYIRLPNGLFLQYPGLKCDFFDDRLGECTYANNRYIYGGLLTENVVQALARIVVADQMLEVDKKYRVVTMTHDEIVAVCPKRSAKRCLSTMVRIMSTAPEWAQGLPLAAEGGFDDCYSK